MTRPTALNSNGVTIGRSVNCSYKITDDTSVTREHCKIRFDGNNIVLTDTSTNGTYFENGQRLIKNKDYVIKPGTKFYLANRTHMLVVNLRTNKA